MSIHDRILGALLAVSTAALAAACGDGITGPGTSGSDVSLSVATGTSAGSVQTSRSGWWPAFDVAQSDGTNDLVLTRVALVLREIELERANAECDDLSGDAEDACEEFETGPRLLELPLDGSVSTLLSVRVPADTYDEIEFEVHKPSRPEDDAFIDANPEFEDISITVEGTWNGTSFTFTQDLNEEQEIELAPALVVSDGSEPTNLTLTVDVTTWFVDPATGDLIDPSTAAKGGANENLVEDNIRNSIEAFEDEDEDGEDDSLQS